MENKKQEIILKAWGHNIPNGGIDENGWSKESCTYGTFDVIKYDQQHYLEGAYIRPRSLKGIDNNNGWIRIESVEDLPPTDKLRIYKVCFIDDDNFILYDFPRSGNNVELGFKNKEITHYRAIEQYSPPIY